MKNNKIATIRLYFSLNNLCNVNCEFCAMHSGTNKNTFLDFNRFKEIIDETTDNFELQLEGGEPLLNPDFYLFLEYARHSNRCNKIIISTNGLLLKKNLQRITDFITDTKIPFQIKHSLNYELINADNKIIKKARDLYLATEFIENFELRFNVRLRANNEDEWLVDELETNKIIDYCDIYELQKYGRLENDNDYEEPFINQNIDKFFIYSSDGINFNQDLIARSNHEKTLK